MSKLKTDYPTVPNITVLSEDFRKLDVLMKNIHLLTINKDSFKLTTQVDHLKKLCKRMNKKNYQSVNQILEDLGKEDEIMQKKKKDDLVKVNQDLTEKVTFNYEKFNKDVILCILFYFEFDEILKLSLVNKEWLELSKDEIIWKNLLAKHSLFYQKELGYRSSFIKGKKERYKWDSDFLSQCLNESKLNIEDHIQILDNGLTLDCTTDNDAHWKYIITTKSLQNNSHFAFEIISLKTPYYFNFSLVQKEGNSFIPGRSHFKNYYSVYSLCVGQTFGLVIQDKKIIIYYDDIQIESHDFPDSNLYPCISLINKAQITIKNQWRPAKYKLFKGLIHSISFYIDKKLQNTRHNQEFYDIYVERDKIELKNSMNETIEFKKDNGKYINKDCTLNINFKERKFQIEKNIGSSIIKSTLKIGNYSLN